MGFENTDYREQALELKNPFDVKLLRDFLNPLGFDFNPEEVDYSMALFNLNGDVVGVGSYQSHILKYVAVAPEFREGAAFSQIATHLIDILILKYKNIFVYTKPRNVKVFVGLGFTEIATAEPLFSVLEFGYENIKTYQDYLRSVKRTTNVGSIASVVVNCNPLTNGHKYLIEKACAENRLVYLFVVEEDKSSFSFAVRWRLLREEFSTIDNLVMVKGGDYVVSGAIFPSYFLKQEDPNEISAKQAELDIITFLRYIVPIFDITRRYVGTENYSPITEAYNTAMLKILPVNGVEVVVVPRITAGYAENYISASKVRKAIHDDRLDEVLDFLPGSTRRYLLSKESLEVRNNIKRNFNRH